MIKCAHLFSGETVDLCWCCFLSLNVIKVFFSQFGQNRFDVLARSWGGSTSLLLLVFSLQQQMHFYSLCSVDKTATIQMIVHPCIVSGSWKHPTVWPSQQKKRRLCIRMEATLGLPELTRADKQKITESCKTSANRLADVYIVPSHLCDFRFPCQPCCGHLQKSPVSRFSGEFIK